MASKHNYNVRKRFSSISIKKAFLVTFLITLFCLIPIFIAMEEMSELNAEIFRYYIFFLIPFFLYLYALKKKNLSFTAILSQPDPNYKLLWFVVPLIVFAIGNMWSITVFLNVLDPGIAETYFGWLMSDETLSITPESSIIQYILIFVLVSVLVPVVEELIFRGILVERLGLKYGYKRAVIISSLIFGVFHADIIGAFVFGVILSIIYLKTKSLLMPVLIHALNNGLVALYTFLEEAIGYEAWETITPYIEYRWIGISLTAITTIWLYKYIKQHWPIVRISTPFQSGSEEPVISSQ